MAIEQFSNGARGTIANSPGVGGLSIDLGAGEGARFPASGPFRVVAWPIADGSAYAGNMELILIDSRSTDTLTVNASGRGYEGTTARNLGTSYYVGLPTLTAAQIDDIRAQLPWGTAYAVINGIDYAQTRAGIQAAIDALPSTGGDIVIPAGASITLDSTQLTCTKDYVRVLCAPSTVIKLPANATELRIIDVQGTLSGTTHSLASNAAEGAATVVITGDVSATYPVGTHIYLSDNQSDPASQVAVVVAVSVSGNTTLTLSEPLCEALATANSAKIQKVTPVAGFEWHGGQIEGNGNSHASSRGIYVRYAIDVRVEDVIARDFTNAAALFVDTFRGGFFGNIRAVNSGDANESDISIYRGSAFDIGEIFSDRASGFGPQIAWSSHFTFGRIVSTRAAGRGFKLHTARYFAGGQIVANNTASSYTGVSFSQRSRKGSVSSIVADYNGAAGVWFADTGTTGTGDIRIGEIQATGNAGPIDVQCGSTTDSVVVDNASFTNLTDAGTGNIFGQTLVVDRVAGLSTANSAAEQTFYTKDLPANFIGLSRGIRVILPFLYLNNSGAGRTTTFKLKLGGTVIAQAVTASIGASASYRGGFVEVFLQGRNDANTQVGYMHLELSAPSTAAVGQGCFDTANAMTGTVAFSASKDATTALTLALTVQHSAADASLELQRYSGALELI